MGEGLTAAKLLRDHRIARLALQVPPVWLWRTDSDGILWANATGAACFRAPTLQAITTYNFSPSDGRPAQVAQVARVLYPGARPRLHRLRGFAPGIGQAIVCACSRVVVADTAALLVAAQESAGPDIPLATRVEFLLAGSQEAMAAFTPDGKLIATTPSARTMIGSACTMSAVGADSLAIAALAEGVASGDTHCGRARMICIGRDESIALLAIFLVAPDRVTSAPALRHHAPPIGSGPTEYTGELARSQGIPAMPREANTEPRPLAKRPTVEPGPLHIEQPPPDRRVPLRFIWQMDQNGRFTLGSDEFIEAIGSRTAVVLGRPWSEVAAELELDPDGAVLRAIETRDTWSGIVVSFPIDGSDDRVAVELSGLPVYDRDRAFLGYRGFGVCRDVERLTQLGWTRRAPVIPASYPGLTPVPASTAAKASSQQRIGAIGTAESIPMLLQQTDGDRAIEPESTTEEEPAGESPTAQPAPPENILLFPAAVADTKSQAASPAPPMPAMLSVGEHDAFQEIARRLQARLSSDKQSGAVAAGHAGNESPAPTGAPGATPAAMSREATELPPTFPAGPPPLPDFGGPGLTAFLNELPVGLMVYRYDQPLFANRAFLAATGFAGLEDLIQAGGLDSLSVGADARAASGPNEVGQALTIIGRDSDKSPIAARLFPVPWMDESALALMLVQPAASDRNKGTEPALRGNQAHISELRSILDTTFDGLVVLSREGVILSANRSAKALFGYEPAEFAGRPFGDLFVPESRGSARDYLDRVHHGGDGDFVANGREMTGQTRQGQTIPLSLILGKMQDGSDRLYAVFRDLTPWKKAEAELSAMRQQPERLGVAPADLLEKFSISVREALSSITGFADLMLEERFGPLGDECYRGCLRDIRAASRHIGGLVDDIQNVSRAETGTLDLCFVPIDLNGLVRECVKALQADANRDRIIIRSSLAPQLRPILADTHSLQQVTRKLLANAIRQAGPGGQVIVSTGETEHGHPVLRVRTTGAAGRKEVDLAGRAAKEASPSPSSSASASVDMVLTRTLAEANRGTLNISNKAEGTLFEVSFPGARIPAE